MKFYVENQSLRFEGIPAKVVSDSVDFVECRFRFDGKWDGLCKFAQFAQGGKVYTQVLTEDVCMLPAEIVAGACDVSVYGQEVGGTTVATTNPYAVNVVQAGFVGDGETPVPPTPDLYSQLLVKIDGAELTAEEAATEATQAMTDAKEAKTAAEVAEGKAKTAQEAAELAQGAAEVAKTGAEEAESNAQDAETAAAQALADLLAMIRSGDIPLLVDGKLPLSYIPATATTEVYVVTSADELTGLVAQRGDLAQLVEDVDDVQTITQSWQLLGDDATVADNWIVWGTSYAVQAVYAATAGTASNANTINNKRIVSMTYDQYESAVLDADTYYLVSDPEEVEA